MKEIFYIMNYKINKKDYMRALLSNIMKYHQTELINRTKKVIRHYQLSMFEILGKNNHLYKLLRKINHT